MFFEDFKEKVNSLKKLSNEEYIEYLLNNYKEIQEELNYVKQANTKAREINQFVKELNSSRYLSNKKSRSMSKIIDANSEFINMFKFFH